MGGPGGPQGSDSDSSDSYDSSDSSDSSDSHDSSNQKLFSPKNLFHKKNFFSHNFFIYIFFMLIFFLPKKNVLPKNSKTQIAMKLKNSICGETPKLKLWGNSTTQNLM